MTQKPWNEMTADEKADHTNQVLEDFIQHQNGANARFSNRIKALEERVAQIEKSHPHE